MGNKKINLLAALLAAAIISMAVPAAANLVSTTFGFPVIVQNGSTSAFNQDLATATEFENLGLRVPAFGPGIDLGGAAMTGGSLNSGDMHMGKGSTANALPFGPVDLAFPSISQTSDQTQNVSHTDFARTSEFAEFTYPFVAAGPVALPRFGF